MPRIDRIWICVLFFMCVSHSAVGQSRELTSLELEDQLQMSAQYAEEGIELDGVLNESIWQQAVAIDEFTQFEPVEGAPATQQTEVRVLYGPNNLYVGAMLYDDEPEAIEQALGRRDDYNRADWFLVSLDSYFDRRTSYTFAVNAAGVQFDAIQSASSNRRRGGSANAPRDMDPSWDAIWYSKARVTSEGWLVEMRIPYSMLRFSDKKEQTWGIHFTRRNPRLGEQSEWPHVPRSRRDNLVAEFGQLKGISDVKPRKNIQVTPYTVTRLLREEDPDNIGSALQSQSMDVGGDLKIGLGPNVTLDATINPDFGQVEADPEVLNLTAFENFFEERRPFFVEGIQIYEFSAGPGRLLYTRRIGANAPIIGATKLSGRTSKGLSFGVLGAATGDDFNPGRGYGVGRVIQQVGEFSSVGGILTVFDEANNEDGDHLRSFALGADWDLRFNNNLYGIEGFFAATNRNWLDAGLDAETGFAGKMWLRKRQGVWDGFVGVDVFSDEFNPNDLGQIRQNNFFALISSVGHDINGGRSFGPFQRGGMRASFIQQVSYDEGINMGQEFDIGTRLTFKGFQSIRFGIEAANLFGGYDIFETRGLLPWNAPSSFNIGGDFETDERKSWQLEPGYDFTFYNNGGRETELSLEGQLNAGSRLSLSAEIRGGWEDNVSAWSSNESFQRSENGWSIGGEADAPDELTAADYVLLSQETNLDPLFADVTPFSDGQYYVSLFGERDTRSADITLRSTVTFTSTLSLQLYGQMFAARGRYQDFQLHIDRDQLVDFADYPKRDEFAFSRLQSNVVLRWEYRPGSSLFLVWTHGRRAEDAFNPLSPDPISPYDNSLNDQFDNTFDIFPQNVFLIKLNYAFLY